MLADNLSHTPLAKGFRPQHLLEKLFLLATSCLLEFRASVFPLDCHSQVAKCLPYFFTLCYLSISFMEECPRQEPTYKQPLASAVKNVGPLLFRVYSQLLFKPHHHEITLKHIPNIIFSHQKIFQVCIQKIFL